MTSATHVHDYLLPRLDALVADAEAHGIARDVAVAVLIDLITSPRFNTAVPDQQADAPAGPSWDLGPDSVALVGGAPAETPRLVGQRDEADFIRPIYPLRPS